MTDQKVFADISMSLDGFIAGPNDRPGNGLGDGGEQLHEWGTRLASWREPHGLEGGETNSDSEIMEEAIGRQGATIVGKRMYDNAEGWGDNPPFHYPVFVLTHESREPLEKEGGTTFTFVDGIEPALEQARAAAGAKDVGIGGGASTIQQFLAAGLLDEIQIHIVPVVLGDGIRLFEKLGRPELELLRVVESPVVAHLRFGVRK